MFSYRQVICNRGTLNGRILRFGGRTGVLRSIYQLLGKSLLGKSMTAINFFRWTPRQALCPQGAPHIQNRGFHENRFAASGLL
jgi:hypothetical protein